MILYKDNVICKVWYQVGYVFTCASIITILWKFGYIFIVMVLPRYYGDWLCKKLASTSLDHSKTPIIYEVSREYL